MIWYGLNDFWCVECEYALFGNEAEAEDTYPYISTWGEDSETTLECPNCGKKYRVKENVTRTWTLEEVPLD